MIKEKRQQAIINLIGAKIIATQEQLTQTLSKAGFEVTQSSVSRDMDELGIVKKSGFYALPSGSNERFGFIGLETAGENLIVVKCESGLASAIAVQIDRAKIIEIVGTIAGDDTIFIAVKNAKTQKAAMKRILGIFEQ
ncbi:MAG: arginine repressor [Acidobacteriota bacterium]|nr:arginine repressor [Acidobacteriota bacterium]